METGHSDTTTQGIRVRVAGEFLPHESDPSARRYVFVYRVVLTNVGSAPAKLLARHWIIRDALGKRSDVRGPGVVGQQPDLAPNASYEYMSGCQLATEWGTMEGTYQMVRPDGDRFDALIGRFFLAPSTAPLAALDKDAGSSAQKI